MMKFYLSSLLSCITLLATAQSGFVPAKLGESINSPYDETHPVISSDGTTLYFTRKNHPQNNFGVKNSEDIWVSSRKADGSWEVAQRSTTLNLGQHNVVLSITEDGNQILLHNDEGLALSMKEDGFWKAPQKISIKATNASLTADGRALVFSKGNKLYRSDRKDFGTWSEPQVVQEFPMKITSPVLLRDGTLFFTSTPKEKGADLFKATRSADGNSWSMPTPLNDTINTVANESDLHTTGNGAWGFYASASKGTKSDIFVVKLYEDHPYVLLIGKLRNTVSRRLVKNKNAVILVDGVTSSSAIVNKDSGTYEVKLPFGKSYNLQAQIDNYGSVAQKVDASGYREFATMTLDLEEQPKPYVQLKGKLLIKNMDKPIPLSAKPKIVVDGVEIDSAMITKGEYALTLNHGTYYYVQVVAKHFESLPAMIDLKDVDGYEEITMDLQADAEKMAIVSGKIVDQKTGQPLSSSVPMRVDVVGIESLAASLDSVQGVYDIRLPLKERHVIRVIAPGYYPVNEVVDVTNETSEISRTQDLVVVPIERGQAIRLNTISFKQGDVQSKSNPELDLNTSSYPELDSVVSFLNKNPSVRIEIGGHTDSSSKSLAFYPAKAVMNYILSKGIARIRVTAKGYGGTRPIVPNTTPEGRAKNKRIEFMIVDM